ncbi:SDR family NAD(P)-dependent oxidoreductase [uncultured Pseudoteredinibacter sp.]|uniref:SDR family NAD(P)-dependent oxidoreductase n=1 Tax=uncultured Pseudoteredinibacter sp. TaxID=1641701 RepID=UPI0026169B36|nr:SDR family NAD(P)-dependent oxidoreductase [uncultured Pseudoteredinibacter sp.]
MNIKGCVAIVSGGNRGIGEAFVLELLEAGAKHVYVGSRDPQNAKALQEKDPQRISVLCLDVADETQIKAAAEQCSNVVMLI